MTESGIGLRDLKKQMTRDSIADAALTLTLKGGLEHVTLKEIARVAFVSPRTVSNYFSCKEEAIAGAGRNLSDSILDDFAERPADEAPLASVRRVAIDFVHSLTPNELEAQRQKRLLGVRYPAINAYLMARYELVEEMLRPAMADRTGTDLDTDIYPWLLAATAVAAVRLAVERWVALDANVDALTRMIDTAFAHLRDGLEGPGPAPATKRPPRLSDSRRSPRRADV